ncbi:glucokinase [Coelomomyces lativittatus]|nr:glucokinase [Coelomomyces lativittatus]
MDPPTMPSSSSSVVAPHPVLPSLPSFLAAFHLSPPTLLELAQHMYTQAQVGLHPSSLSSTSTPAMKMIPSFVTHLPTGHEQGHVLVVDLGGTNLRVCGVTLQGHHQFNALLQQQYVIPDHMKARSGHVLFQYVAECVDTFLVQHHLALFNEPREKVDENKQEKETEKKRGGGQEGSSSSITTAATHSHPVKSFKDLVAMKKKTTSTTFPRLRLGFTFSFPVLQTQLNQGTLIHWNKGFECSDILNCDVVQLLQQKLNERELPIVVTALINDTIGTLAAHRYVDPTTCMGVILGTGSNAAYIEQKKNILKLNAVSSTPTTEGHPSSSLNPHQKNETDEEKKTPADTSSIMLINTEWGGAMDPFPHHLPLTLMDEQLNQLSVHPGRQRYEKMISGAYLGELVRLALVHFHQLGLFLPHVPNDLVQRSKLYQPGQFESAFMSTIESETSSSFPATHALFTGHFGFPTFDTPDFEFVHPLVHAVAYRAAQLSAAGILALLHLSHPDVFPLTHAHQDTPTQPSSPQVFTIAMDGSVWRKYPGFQAWLANEVRGLLNDPSLSSSSSTLNPPVHLNFVSAIDGSAIGAAVVALVHEG